MDVSFVEIPQSYELRNTAIGKDKDILLLLVKLGFFEDDSVHTVVASLECRNLQKQVLIQNLEKIPTLSIPERTKVTEKIFLVDFSNMKKFNYI